MDQLNALKFKRATLRCINFLNIFRIIIDSPFYYPYPFVSDILSLHFIFITSLHDLKNECKQIKQVYTIQKIFGCIYIYIYYTFEISFKFISYPDFQRIREINFILRKNFIHERIIFLYMKVLYVFKYKWKFNENFI